MHKNAICTIINITQQNDNYMLRRSGQKDLSTHSHTVWLQLVLSEKARLGLDCSGRSLGTSFNSTLLWKLQLPLSRLVPLLHPYAAVASTTQSTPTDLQSGRNPSPKTSDVCWRTGVCVFVYVFVCSDFQADTGQPHPTSGVL